MVGQLTPEYNFDENLNTALSELPGGENAQTSKEEEPSK